MYGVYESKHCLLRSQQRCVSKPLRDVILQYGDVRPCGGKASKFYLSKNSLIDVFNECGIATYKMCEKLRNAYVILSADCTIITVARNR